MFEHGWDQGATARETLEIADFVNIETLQDLQGHDRVTVGEKPEARFDKPVSPRLPL